MVSIKIQNGRNILCQQETTHGGQTNKPAMKHKSYKQGIKS